MKNCAELDTILLHKKITPPTPHTLIYCLMFRGKLTDLTAQNNRVGMH